MALELRLNEPGYIQLKALNRDLMAKTEEIKQKFGSDEKLMKQKLQELAQTYDHNMQSFLKPDQMQAYANFKKENTHTRFVAAGAEN
ncbi:hypothetical protein [Pontibacter akesuensis]|nr:hypothetical protein [Pontibacter akesuensis]GHA78811.1 hypothetical protein GCM10007389_36110 [Pontibacter akesuensis]